MVLPEFFNDKIHQKIVEDTFATFPYYYFRMVRYKDLSHYEPKYRWHLTFRIDSDSWCMVSSFRSSEKVLFLYHDDEAAGMSVLQIKPHEHGLPFKDLTYLDCNIKDEENRKTMQDLKDSIDWKIKIETNDDIPLVFSRRIAQAIVNSPHTSNEIKKGFRKSRPELFYTDGSMPNTQRAAT